MLFEKKEYKERLKNVKDLMQKQGIDLLVSHDPANMNYLTGMMRGLFIMHNVFWFILMRMNQFVF